MSTITLDRALIDYLTVTSYEPMARDVAKSLKAMLTDTDYRGKAKELRQELQYLGWQVDTGMGTVFYGEGVQGGREHFMFRVSGELCNEDVITLPLGQGVREGWLRVRRVDIQMTTQQPDGWLQWALFNRQQLAKRSVGWHESTDKEGHKLATVYIGQRTSGKFARIYQKWAGCYLLRCEYEVKGNMAEAYGQVLFSGKETPSTLLRLLLSQTSDEPLSAAYENQLSGIRKARKPEVVKIEPKTKKWLSETVLPTFVRYVNDHANDAVERQEVVSAFTAAIADYAKWYGVE